MRNEESRQNENNLEYEQEYEEPSLYQVVLHSDDFTPIEFVIGMLEKFFYMDRRTAAERTLEVYAKGKAACGIFSRDFAESRLEQIKEYAGSHDYPLACSMEVA